MAAKQSPIGILDAAAALQETTELERPEVNVPDAVVDLFQAHVVAGTDGRDIDPVLFQWMPPLVLTRGGADMRLGMSARGKVAQPELLIGFQAGRCLSDSEPRMDNLAKPSDFAHRLSADPHHPTKIEQRLPRNRTASRGNSTLDTRCSRLEKGVGG